MSLPQPFLMKSFVKASNLIIDLGMNNGDDTDYYLKTGARVVAVDANPELCAVAAKRFAKQVESGALTILNAAVDSDHDGQKPFYVNLENDHWSSSDIGWAAREQTSVRKIMVNRISIARLFESYGVPLYMKVDVEGADEMVLDQLAFEENLPHYLSVEDCRFGYRYLSKLSGLGYAEFKLLDQSSVETMTDDRTGHAFQRGASGPFGETIPGAWLDNTEIEELYSKTVRDRLGNRLAPRTHWLDIHARAAS